MGWLVLLLLLWGQRKELLLGLSGWLAATDVPGTTAPRQALFVLAGGPIERGYYAARLYQAGVSRRIICTGELEPQEAVLDCRAAAEAALTRKAILHRGVPENSVAKLPVGTSTQEEVKAILAYCQQHHLTRIGLVSSRFHTRRIRLVAERSAWLMGIDLAIYGAPSIQYDPELWWKTENGLLFVFSEYVKLAYYLYKY